MNDLIARARDLDRAATPGPWVVDKRKIHDSVHYTIRTRDRQPERPHSEAYLFWMCGSLGQAAYNSNPADYADDQIVKRNGDFIAESRTLLPALADALEIERKARAEWEIEAQDLRDRAVQLESWVAQARPVIEAVREWQRARLSVLSSGVDDYASRVSDFGTAQNRIMTIALPPKETP